MSLPIMNSLLVNSQLPLDDKTYKVTLAALKDLGTSNQKAFIYYEGMEVYCNENRQKYTWKEVTAEDPAGLLATPFTYPSGSITNGIDYSGRKFNFIPSTLQTAKQVDSKIAAANLITGGTSIKEIKPLSSEQAYLDLVANNQDDPTILYLTPEPTA